MHLSRVACSMDSTAYFSCVRISVPNGTYGTQRKTARNVALRPLGGACLLVLLQSSDILSWLWLTRPLELTTSGKAKAVTMETSTAHLGGHIGTTMNMASTVNDLTDLCRHHSPRLILFVSRLVPCILPPASFLELKPSLTRVPMKSR